MGTRPPTHPAQIHPGCWHLSGGCFGVQQPLGEFHQEGKSGAQRDSPGSVLQSPGCCSHWGAAATTCRVFIAHLGERCPAQPLALGLSQLEVSPTPHFCLTNRMMPLVRGAEGVLLGAEEHAEGWGTPQGHHKKWDTSPCAH